MIEAPASHQRLLVMPDDGAESVVELIDAASSQLLLKQFKLQSPQLMEALRRCVSPGRAALSAESSKRDGAACGGGGGGVASSMEQESLRAAEAGVRQHELRAAAVQACCHQRA